MIAVAPALIEATLIDLMAEHGSGKSFSPTDAARRLGGGHPDGWGPLMQPIRKIAIDMALQGRIVILRKGRPVDPADFKGVYRLTMPHHE